MTFSQLGLPAFLLGLLAIAGVLFLLQRLRVRFRELEVVTTLFWKQALQETRARVFLRRFRHPLAYLLALALTGLIWLALAEPRWNREAEGEYVLLLDGSAGMDWGDRFVNTGELLLRETARLPAGQRRVFFCGPDPRLILDRNEETYLLRTRLASLSPEPCPASIDRHLRELARTPIGALTVLVFGDAPVSQTTLDALPSSVAVERVRAEGAVESSANNTALAGLGISGAASGAFDRVDAFISITGIPTDPAFTAMLGDAPLNQSPATVTGGYLLADLPARGEVLEITLAGNDLLPADNQARVVLPSRSPLPIRFDGPVDPRLRAVVEIDPALTPSDEPADSVAVVVTGEAPSESGNPTPALHLSAGNAITVVHEASLSPTALARLRDRLGQAGLERVGKRIDPGGEREFFELEVRFEPGEQRRVRLGMDLLGDDYDFTQSSAFPIFLSESLRWLGGLEPPIPFALAGEPLIPRDTLAIAGAGFAPPRAGNYETAEGRSLAVSLGSSMSPGKDALSAISETARGPIRPSLFTLCLLAALLVVGGEWWLFQKGRIP